jgi:hypothetical protein
MSGRDGFFAFSVIPEARVAAIRNQPEVDTALRLSWCHC